MYIEHGLNILKKVTVILRNCLIRKLKTKELKSDYEAPGARSITRSCASCLCTVLLI